MTHYGMKPEAMDEFKRFQADVLNTISGYKPVSYTHLNLLQYADLEKKVEDVHSSYDRTGKELKGVEARLREVQPLIKNISNYQRLKQMCIRDRLWIACSRYTGSARAMTG